MSRALSVFIVATLLAACSTAPPAEPPAPEEAPAAPEAPVAFGSVDVPRDGKQFNPPVAADQIPEGAYYCDMGDVHYARITPGDGSCPVCGMELSHKVSKLPAEDVAPTEAPAEPAAETTADPATETTTE